MTLKEIEEIKIFNMDGIEFLNNLEDNSVDLILTDPPYITSRDSGLNLWKKHTNDVDRFNKKTKTEEDWGKYIEKNKTNKNTKDIEGTEEQKKNYIKYGSIYGKKYSVQTDYGDWDNNFTLEKLEEFVELFYKKLKKGGTCIIWFDLWKITPLKDLLEKNKFKQIRFIEWIKTNPQPLNSKVNYLTNCREIALLGIKISKPTFNSKYDNGSYSYPLQGGKNRFHPTQKSLKLFEELIEKHSKEGDLVVDTFLGSGTTAVAARNTNRNFKGCEINKEYYDKMCSTFDLGEIDDIEVEYKL